MKPTSPLRSPNRSSLSRLFPQSSDPTIKLGFPLSFLKYDMSLRKALRSLEALVRFTNLNGSFAPRLNITTQFACSSNTSSLSLITEMNAFYKHTTQFETLGSLEGVGDVALAYVTYFSALGHSTHWLGSYL